MELSQQEKERIEAETKVRFETTKMLKAQEGASCGHGKGCGCGCRGHESCCGKNCGGHCGFWKGLLVGVVVSLLLCFICHRCYRSYEASCPVGSSMMSHQEQPEAIKK